MKLRALLLCHLVLAVLVSTFLWPFTQVYWDRLDLLFFNFLNQSLEGRPLWQFFWALANHKLMDWVEDGIVLGFFVAYVLGTAREKRPRALAELLFCTLYIAAIIFFVNRVLFRETLCIHRDSPTLVVDSCIKLSKEIPWMSIKDDSNKSFPGDHATTIILFAALFMRYAGRRLGLLACLYTVFRTLPRLIAGAHWLSDVLVGSGAIVLPFLSWALCTPLHTWVIDRFEAFFRLFTKQQRTVIQ